MNRWFGARAAKKELPTMVAAEEDQHLQDAEEALLKLLNDDVAEADRILRQGNSSYHHLGRGISSFLASMLGAEKELFKEAATTLQLAEGKTWEDMKLAQKESTAYHSHIYPPGTEYLLCYAISQLTGAICAVFSGSVTEAIKGFYKLRKAYLTLHGILEIELNYLRKHGASSAFASSKHTSDRQEVRERDLEDKRTSIDRDTHPPTIEKLQQVDLNVPDTRLSPTLTKSDSRIVNIDTASLGIETYTDVFTHSGTRLCFGTLLLIFSMIENPLFTKILYIVGFKGDRDRGLRYLWNATSYTNFNSAIAGIALLGYYNASVALCDILPTDAGADNDLSGYPKARCRTLLNDMRERYPESRLWKVEEARMYSQQRDLATAVQILRDNADSHMKQIAAINMFELSLSVMFAHDYELCVKFWVQLAELSSWAPALYSYLVGAAYLELYRKQRQSESPEAVKLKLKAAEYLRRSPSLAGRQKVMAKELPFDTLIVRKIRKWEERAKQWKVDFVDSIGVSPLTEMIYLWNGLKKQSPELLKHSLAVIAWQRTCHPRKHEADLDDLALDGLLRACILRNMGQYDDSRAILQSEILSHDEKMFKGDLKDDWICPCAHYEMACLAWIEKDLPGSNHEAKLIECEKWLTKTQNWPQPYLLDTRISFRVSTSLATVKRHMKLLQEVENAQIG